jgi:hypothetical protein
MQSLAERLAGGFRHVVSAEELEPAIRTALGEDGFAEIEPIRTLPGMVRAIARSLRQVWESDLDLAQLAATSPRLADLALIEARVRAQLRPAAFLPRDIREAAIDRILHASAVAWPDPNRDIVAELQSGGHSSHGRALSSPSNGRLPAMPIPDGFRAWSPGCATRIYYPLPKSSPRRSAERGGRGIALDA